MILLGFIGVKLVLRALHETGVHVLGISTTLSLSVIGGVLLVTTVTSLIAARRNGQDGEAAERRAAEDRVDA